MAYELLQRYGSPVRIGTNELVFSDMQAFSDILGQSSDPCPKDAKIYGSFTATGAINIANAVDRRQHARLRRLLSHGFSAGQLLDAEPMIAGKINYYIDTVFRPKTTGDAVEIYRGTHHLFLDISSELSFGKSFDTLRGHNLNASDDIESFFTVIPAVSRVHFIRYLPFRNIQEAFRGVDRLKRFSQKNVSSFMEDLTTKEIDARPSGFLKNLVLAKDPESGLSLTYNEIVENSIIFIVAGSGTTSITTIFLLWEVARTPDVQAKLVAEIRNKFPDPKIMPTYEEASKLPYLTAVIDETLRLHGALSTPLPRVSPGKVLCGHYVPKGTHISVNPYATARDPAVFPHPHDFLPDRWLSATSEMRNMSRPFSYGPRNCIGKHLAEIGMYLTIARVMQLMDLTLNPRTTGAKMAHRDQGGILPMGNKLYLDVRQIR